MSSSYPHYPTSSLRSTSSTQTRSRPLPTPANLRLLVDISDTKEHSQGNLDDDDEFLYGYSERTLRESSGSEETDEDDVPRTPPPSSLPDVTQIQTNSYNDTFPASPPSSPIKSSAHPTVHAIPALDGADDVDENDDAAFFQFLVKKGAERQNIDLARPQPTPPVDEPLLPESPKPNDSLDLYFQTAHEDSDVEMDDTQTHADEHQDRRRRRAVTFLESLPLKFWTQLHTSSQLLGSSGRGKEKNAARSSQSQGSQSSQEETPQVGLSMSTMDRKTGDIYYRDVGLFKSQRVVDKIVDDLVATAELKREDFHVCAAAKGLIASTAIKITMESGDGLTLSSTMPTLIPPNEAIRNIEAPDGLDWILVVEKDAVMQTLCGSRLLEDTRLGPGALVTGKGFPDLSTVQLLHRLAYQFPAAQIYALMDADPHGFGILSVYAHGSKANRNSAQYRGLALGDRIKFLGIKATEWASMAQYEDLLPLSARDVQLAQKMCAQGSNLKPEWRRELVHMLHLHRKAEIQILSGPLSASAGDYSLGGSNRLVEYIVSKIAHPPSTL